jgi:hypothetical protein
MILCNYSKHEIESYALHMLVGNLFSFYMTFDFVPNGHNSLLLYKGIRRLKIKNCLQSSISVLATTKDVCDVATDVTRWLVT